jgi:hypothetical protein
MAARIMHNAEARGKRITASNAAYYALQHCKSGRRAVGHSEVDVHGSATQLQGHSRLESLEQVVASNEENGGEIFELHDVLASNQEDPATIDTSTSGDKGKQDKTVSLVEQMMTAQKQLAAAHSDADKEFYGNKCESIDKQIDALVYELYGLTPEEVKIVEGAA